MLELYRSCYNLEGEPFRLGPDHRFSFAHRSYANAKAYLQYALAQGEGFIAITGGPGTGKTTLIGDLLDDVDRSRILIATLTSAQLDLDHLITLVISSFGLQMQGNNIALSLIELEKFLIQRNHRGDRAILIVDEAQGLSPASLEELRLLSNLQHEDRLLLQVFLVGQDGLLEMIQMPGMEHLHQRLIAASSLEPLDLDETVSYLEYRLCRVGWQGDPMISEAAIRVIHRYSSGIPRRINLIAHRLFLYGGMQQKHALSGEDARQVIEELRKEHLLAAEVAMLELPEEDILADSGDSGDSSRTLPRAESFALAQQHSELSTLPASGELEADITPQEFECREPKAGVQDSDGEPFTRMEPENPGESSVQQSDPGSTAAGDRKVDATQSHQRWLWTTFMVLLAGLLFSLLVQKDLRDRLISYANVVFQTADHHPASLPATPPETPGGPHDQDSAVRQNHDSVANSAVPVPNKPDQAV